MHLLSHEQINIRRMFLIVYAFVLLNSPDGMQKVYQHLVCVSLVPQDYRLGVCLILRISSLYLTYYPLSWNQDSTGSYLCVCVCVYIMCTCTQYSAKIVDFICSSNKDLGMSASLSADTNPPQFVQIFMVLRRWITDDPLTHIHILKLYACVCSYHWHFNHSTYTL